MNDVRNSSSLVDYTNREGRPKMSEYVIDIQSNTHSKLAVYIGYLYSLLLLMQLRTEHQRRNNDKRVMHIVVPIIHKQTRQASHRMNIQPSTNQNIFI